MENILNRSRLRSANSSKSDSKRSSVDSRQFQSEVSNGSDNSNSSFKKTEELMEIEEERDDEDGVNKQLKMLSYDAGGSYGKFMADFDPERSGREMRKMNRRIYRERGRLLERGAYYDKYGARKNQLYDETGRLFENSQDLCDCLDVDCPGCHFPCSKCGSEKCGTECRCNRKYVYESVEVEGTDVVIKWPT